MTEQLLTAKEIEAKIFRKASFGGYVVAEVDEFLDQICEDVEMYATRCMELQLKVEKMEAELGRYDGIKDSLQETLLMAQRVAHERETEAADKVKQMEAECERRVAEIESEAEGIIAAAREERSKILTEAEQDAQQSEERIKEAEKEAERIVQSGYEERARIIHDAEQELEGLRANMDQIKNDKASFIRSGYDLLNSYNSLLTEACKTLEN